MWSDDAVLSAYLNDVRQYAVLTAEQERDLARRIKHGRQAEHALRIALHEDDRPRLQHLVRAGVAARDEFVACNQRLVIFAAKRYLHRGLALMDLIQEGNLGLLTAVDQFDGEREIRFSTFAMYWIRHALRRGVMQRGRAIPLPIHVAEAAEQLERRRDELEDQLGREPTDCELAAAVGLSIERFHALGHVSQPPYSIDAPRDARAHEPWVDTLIDAAPLPDEQALRAVEGEMLRALVARMEPPERSVLTLRFGLADGQPRSRQATARLLNLPCDVVVRRERSGLAWLRTQTWQYLEPQTMYATDSSTRRSST